MKYKNFIYGILMFQFCDAMPMSEQVSQKDNATNMNNMQERSIFEVLEDFQEVFEELMEQQEQPESLKLEAFIKTKKIMAELDEKISELPIANQEIFIEALKEANQALVECEDSYKELCINTECLERAQLAEEEAKGYSLISKEKANIHETFASIENAKLQQMNEEEQQVFANEENAKQSLLDSIEHLENVQKEFMICKASHEIAKLELKVEELKKQENQELLERNNIEKEEMEEYRNILESRVAIAESINTSNRNLAIYDDIENENG